MVMAPKPPNAAGSRSFVDRSILLSNIEHHLLLLRYYDYLLLYFCHPVRANVEFSTRALANASKAGRHSTAL